MYALVTGQEIVLIFALFHVEQLFLKLAEGEAIFELYAAYY
jgi:hypothetical protein